MDKEWWRSKTAWGGVLTGVSVATGGAGAYLTGNTDLGTCLTALATGIGIIITAIGLRSAISTQKK